MEGNDLKCMNGDPLGNHFKRNSWKSRSFGYHRPKTIVEENYMRPDRSGIPKRKGKKKILGGLKRIRQKSCSFEEDIPTHDTSPTLRKSSNGETQSYISLAASSELFEGLEGSKESVEEVQRRGGPLARSRSYVVKEKEDCSEMTAASPLIIDVGDMKVECVVGEKNGTATLATQTEQVPAGLGAETSLELLKKLSIPSLRRELERKKVRFSKNDGKDQLQAKLEAVLKLETCPPTCPLTKGKIVIHSEPAELKRKAQQIAVMAHNTDTPQVLGEASKQLSHVTQEVRVIRQLLEAHVHHIRAVSDHSTTECGCNMMLENLCHSLSHYHVRKLESQLQETLSEINMLQLEKHTLLRAVSRLCNKRNTPSPHPLSAALPQRPLSAALPQHPLSAMRPQRPLSAALPRSISARSMANCTPCEHGDCRIDYLTSLMENVLQQHH